MNLPVCCNACNRFGTHTNGTAFVGQLRIKDQTSLDSNWVGGLIQFQSRLIIKPENFLVGFGSSGGTRLPALFRSVYIVREKKSTRIMFCFRLWLV